jgi:hypothetical protein
VKNDVALIGVCGHDIAGADFAGKNRLGQSIFE